MGANRLRPSTRGQNDKTLKWMPRPARRSKTKFENRGIDAVLEIREDNRLKRSDLNAEERNALRGIIERRGEQQTLSRVQHIRQNAKAGELSVKSEVKDTETIDSKAVRLVEAWGLV